jgi:RimJ/RimL family protein N-acetyltransferase
MSMTPPLTVIRARNGPYYLREFSPPAAPVIATWARDAGELFWLAPSTPPPLSTEKVMAWLNDDASPLLLGCDRFEPPMGYLELNLMSGQPGHLWLGHCVVCPEHRGCGLGRVMIDLALDDAFAARRAESVSLVVFPENRAAVNCYQRVGFVVVGEQIKDFHTSDRPHRMLRMSITADRYRRLRTSPPPK